ncbi:TonB-dependent receptor [Rhizosphaericola mali]|uniref:TonB-dependent receptor n=1 Tax=Rhizosphaericola mali TaxID=2545455 RepID=A0A5P2G0I8_9BACT|nr:TonB-dependent receptor [Rhizosphaericola mali]QES87639.1 TonB-dependent receptor [Rhizosphaericola mali]
MTRKYLLLFFLIIYSKLYTQTLQGGVHTKNGQPIDAATVHILNTDRTTTTDREGKFIFSNIKEGRYQLNVTRVGYASLINSVKVGVDKTSTSIILTENGKQLDDIVVSSDKIETRLQQTPVAVSSLSAQKLNDYRAWNIADLTALVPSLYVIEHGNSTGSNFFNIRGTMGFSNGQSVATYVDGVYQFDYYSAPINFNNIERIEILRGPQGTLYGRNAFSGVVNIFTKKPTNGLHGYAEVDLGNYGQQRYTVGINTPIVKDKLFFNVSGQYNGRGSIYSDPTLNMKHYDGRKDYNINGNLKYFVNDKWQININAKTEHDDDRGAYPWAASDSAARNHPYQYFGNWENIEKRNNTNVSATINYFGKHFNFTSITSGIDYHIWIPGRYDFDFTSANLISGSNATRSRELTQEFRFTSPASISKWKWTGGAFLFAEKIKTNTNTYYDEDYAAYNPSAPYGTLTYTESKNSGIAFFGQATYNLTSKLNITMGARYDVERRQQDQTINYEKDEVITPLSGLESNHRTFNAFTPKVTLSYKLTDNSLVYASFAKGFRVGGFNIGATTVSQQFYSPEKSDNYEVAIKNNLFDNRLKLNVTAFYLQQKDQQVGTSTDGVNSLTLNVGNMNNFGIETEVTAILVKNLSIDWNASWSDAKYAKLNLYDYTSGSTVNYKGNRPINNPNISSMLAVQYNFPLTQTKQSLSLFVRGEYRYIGKYYLDFVNTDTQSGYGLVNARAGITAKKFEIAFWGRNINNVRYIAYGYGSYLLGSPRMYGVTFSIRF